MSLLDSLINQMLNAEPEPIEPPRTRAFSAKREATDVRKAKEHWGPIFEEFEGEASTQQLSAFTKKSAVITNKAMSRLEERGFVDRAGTVPCRGGQMIIWQWLPDSVPTSP